MSVTIPVGALFAYAGIQSEDEINQLGWFVCKGQKFDVNSYQELYAAIGTANGGDGITYFNIPDLRGMFLRGVDGLANRDKDAAARISPRNGAASGDAPGSIQGDATANAQIPFQVTVPHRPTDDHNAYHGSNESKLGHTDNSITVQSNDGGGKETRPINANVLYIIKYTSSASMPAGLVIPFAGTVNDGLAADWLFCDGTLYNQSDYANLFTAIGATHGGDSTQFNVPDYRGMFLRGVDEGKGVDPDAALRTAAAVGGATGDTVGSKQDWDTAKPKNPFSVSLAHISSDCDRSDRCAGHTNANWNGGAVTIDFTSLGGDNESRPINSNVDWFIKTNPEQDANTDLPIGTVIAYPSNKYPANSIWLACDGSQLPIISPFTNLFKIIGTAHGGDGIRNFSLPDYRGIFLRGVDHGAKRDPDADKRTKPTPSSGASGDNIGSLQDYATKKRTSITGAVPHLPTEGHDNACAISGPSTYDVGAWNGGAENIKIQGGDKETRPVNTSVVWYIKYTNG